MRLLLVALSFLVVTTFCSYGGNDMLKVGSEAPQFVLAAENGDTVRLADFREKNPVVLIFYPGDETPGCTKQLCAVRDDYSRFEKRGVKVFGVNPGSGKSHEKFIQKHNFQFQLLVDEKKTVTEAYGAKGALMTKRTVYAVDKAGKIIFARRGMPSVKEILASIPAAEKESVSPPVKLDLKVE